MTRLPAYRVLVVEDEFLIRMMLAEALTDEGWAVTEAASGDEALGLLQAGAAIDLILTDLNLPGTLDGVALAARARLVQPDLPVIFVTGRPDSITRSSLHRCDEVVPKPYLPSEICAAARRLLERC